MTHSRGQGCLTDSALTAVALFIGTRLEDTSRSIPLIIPSFGRRLIGVRARARLGRCAE